MYETYLNLDMWNGSEYDASKHYVRVWFRDSDSKYVGNVYEQDTNKAVGDFVSNCSIKVEKAFNINWD